MSEPADRPQPAARRAAARAATAACFAAALLLFLTRVVGERITSDEQIFVGGAGLMARGDGLIYRDFFYTHLPLHPLILAGLFRLDGHWMLIARLVDAICAAGVVALVFDATRRSLSGSSAAIRYAGAAAVAVVFVFNPIVAYSGGVAWNHNVAALCSLAAIALWPTGESPRRAFVSGALAAAAVTARLTFAPVMAVLPIAVALTLRRRPESQKTLMAWFAGAAIVALPSIVVCLISPAAAYFENVRYPGLTAQFSADLGDNPRVTFMGKLAYVREQYGRATAAALIAASLAVATLACVCARPRDDRRARLIAVVAACVIAFAAAFAATPMFRQYLYAPLPFAALALAWSLAMVRPSWQRAAVVALLPIAAYCLINGRRGYRSIAMLDSPSTWTTTRWHADARALAARVSPGGKVLTLMPGLPLEADRPIYLELSIGRYAARSAAYLTPAQRSAYRVPTLDDIRRWFATDPPAAVLINAPLDTALEHDIAAIARDAGYRSEPLGPRWTLCLPPGR